MSSASHHHWLGVGSPAPPLVSTDHGERLWHHHQQVGGPALTPPSRRLVTASAWEGEGLLLHTQVWLLWVDVAEEEQSVSESFLSCQVLFLVPWLQRAGSCWCLASLSCRLLQRQVWGAWGKEIPGTSPPWDPQEVPSSICLFLSTF